MNWDEMDWRGNNYYLELSAHIKAGSFFSSQSPMPRTQQVGVFIVERIDIAMEAAIDEEDGDFISLLTSTFLTAVKCMAKEVESHLRMSIGCFTFSGLLASYDSEVKNMWKEINQYLSSGNAKTPWLLALSQTAINDEDFCDKVRDSRLYQERGLDRTSILEKLASDYEELNVKNTSVSKLELLSIV